MIAYDAYSIAEDLPDLMAGIAEARARVERNRGETVRGVAASRYIGERGRAWEIRFGGSPFSSHVFCSCRDPLEMTDDEIAADIIEGWDEAWDKPRKPDGTT